MNILIKNQQGPTFIGGSVLHGLLQFFFLLFHLFLCTSNTQQRLHLDVQLPPRPVAKEQELTDVPLDHCKAESAGGIYTVFYKKPRAQRSKTVRVCREKYHCCTFKTIKILRRRRIIFRSLHPVHDISGEVSSMRRAYVKSMNQPPSIFLFITEASRCNSKRRGPNIFSTGATKDI